MMCTVNRNILPLYQGLNPSLDAAELFVAAVCEETVDVRNHTFDRRKAVDLLVQDFMGAPLQEPLYYIAGPQHTNH